MVKHDVGVGNYVVMKPSESPVLYFCCVETDKDQLSDEQVN